MNMLFPSQPNCTVAVIGLGYVGLPLACEISKQKRSCIDGSLLSRQVIGFDINLQRLHDLKLGIDTTNELRSQDLLACSHIKFTSNPNDLVVADVFIVTVPTPIDNSKRPDLNPLIKASKTVGQALKSRASRIRSNGESWLTPIVIYESTVYPGATEEICIPIIESESGLYLNNYS